MKLKQNALLILILGFIILLIGALMPLVCWKNYAEHYGSIGLIGAADNPPSYWFALYAMFDGLPLVLVILGITLFISSAFCLLLSKMVKVHCDIKTFAISLGLSGIGTLGLICAFSWLTMVSFDEMAKHPIEYPVSVLLGILCTIAFVILLVLYFKVRRMNWSMKGFVIDVLTGIVYLPTFFCVFAYLYQIIA